ncbi:secreted protein [Streptomyces viridochromogenes DSM 40736]|uniref:Secreted protein n=1 Tax=Streptomyces viridochromogenes (strain DSM 40736 / JCM 4977 / BCRC 1201 / Tue 494) TaxID=591159 RepID=D9XCK8_STRVT|nr:S16 family serine protease [Streptomyces viridochromogenes]EFL32465.1 secreted protein [Streptomyces viridochromogenes DSM 40736]
MFSRLTRPQALAVCALPVVALIATAVFAPLPFSVAQPGETANVLGEHKGAPVITISGAPTRGTRGQLRMTTIVATSPDTRVSFPDVVDSWFRSDEAVMPRDALYPSGDSVKEIERHNEAQMKESQNAATQAALGYLGLDGKDVKVSLKLADVGGPSAGLLFSLGIVDKLDGDGTGGDLTGGRVIAGTGTIEADGKVGAVGGVALKTQAARRDGATVFLVPKAECTDARAELPKGLRLVPVTNLKSAVSSLVALETGKGSVPRC